MLVADRCLRPLELVVLLRCPPDLLIPAMVLGLLGSVALPDPQLSLTERAIAANDTVGVPEALQWPYDHNSVEGIEGGEVLH